VEKLKGLLDDGVADTLNTGLDSQRGLEAIAGKLVACAEEAVNLERELKV